MNEKNTRPPFNSPVENGGYHWWYLDALDPDTEQGVVVIVFVGSVFSPYYFRARQRDGIRADPEKYCAVNIGLYGKSYKHWSMTERNGADLYRDENLFRLGPSQVWARDDGSMEFVIRERSTPGGKAMRGSISIEPITTTSIRHSLDPDGIHTWAPWAPDARVSVTFQKPGINWTGHAYLDSNFGSAPLENTFNSWDWSRCKTDRGVEIQYDSRLKDGSESVLMLNISKDGDTVFEDAPERQTLKRTGWGIHRSPRADYPIRLNRTLEDTPFYSRSLLSVERPEGAALAVHESLSLDRFSQAWVRTLLPFRMPRTWWK